MWSSVTVRLRNSHSAYLHTPGVTTRKPLPAVIQIPGLCRVLGRTSLFTLPMVPVLFNTTLPWEQSIFSDCTVLQLLPTSETPI